MSGGAAYPRSAGSEPSGDAWRWLRILAVNDSSDDCHAVWTVELEYASRLWSENTVGGEGGAV